MKKGHQFTEYIELEICISCCTLLLQWLSGSHIKHIYFLIHKSESTVIVGFYHKPFYLV